MILVEPAPALRADPGEGILGGSPGHCAILLRMEVTDELLEAAEGIHDGWYADGPVDWDTFWDRLDQWGFPIEDLDSPEARKIQRFVRGLKG